MTDVPEVSPASLIAGRWLQAVVDDGDLAAAWALTDRPLRVALAQSFIGASMDQFFASREAGGMTEAEAAELDPIAEELADEGPASTLWEHFEPWRMQRWLEITFASMTNGRWGFIAQPAAELIAPDLEFARIAVDPGEGGFMPGGAEVRAQTFVMRLVDDRWLVAGIGRTLPVPGWPPREEEIPN